MRAAFIHAAYDVRLGELPEPVPGDGEVLVDIECVGICGSDLHYYKDGAIGAAQVIAEPFVPGHEFAGRVRESIPGRGIEAGDLVVIDPCQPCGRCEWCLRGEHNLCPKVVMHGAPPKAGAMTRTIAARRDQLFAAPRNFDATAAAMAEPLGVGIHATDLARPQWFESVVILGAGPIGLIILQLVRLAGADRVMVVDPVDYRRRKALELGAQEVSAHHEDTASWTGGRGADLVIEATNSPEGLQHAADAARIGGRCVIVGIPDGNTYRIEASAPRRKQLTMMFSRRMGDVIPRAIRLIADGRVDMKALVSHHIDLDDVPEAFRKLAACEDGAIKIIVDIAGHP
ncbi:MAG: alcohol dehydrogenase catalytic domain-containing protein [Geminicoccaceae bacterium]|nr:alcohol dehydrogenase catalytic domain-containing protein [Geminicoccaceae bacterium]